MVNNPAVRLSGALPRIIAGVYPPPAFFSSSLDRGLYHCHHRLFSVESCGKSDNSQSVFESFPLPLEVSRSQAGLCDIKESVREPGVGHYLLYRPHSVECSFNGRYPGQHRFDFPNVPGLEPPVFRIARLPQGLIQSSGLEHQSPPKNLALLIQDRKLGGIVPSWYLTRHFATESGKSKGQFYTPAEAGMHEI
jgi:hypothetical protein